MKKLFAILTALVMLISCAAAEEAAPTNTAQITFDANYTTPYRWYSFVLAGDSVTLDSPDGVYVSDPNPEMLDGVGGKVYFDLTAVHPGLTLIAFWHADDLSPVEYDCLYLADVDEDMHLYLQDVTEGSTFEGFVAAVNEEDHSVALDTELLGEIIARFDENEALPVEGEHIKIYTNGVMTMSLPPIVNVLAWNTIMDDLMRYGLDVVDTAELVDMLADASAEFLQKLACDEAYLSMYGLNMLNEDTLQILHAYQATKDMQPVVRHQLKTENLTALYGVDDGKELSEEAAFVVNQRVFNAGYLAGRMTGYAGVAALSITSALQVYDVVEEDLPSMLYLLQYENNVGILLGIWSNGSGVSNVSAQFLPNADLLSTDAELSALLW